MPAAQNGELHIHFAEQNKQLIITIADNGIGLEQSKQLRSTKKHNSRGMQLINERLELLGKLSGHSITLTIKEQFPGQDNPGTLITLFYPEEVYTNYIKLKA
jgi:two-component system, sensor histidine kinase YesM